MTKLKSFIVLALLMAAGYAVAHDGPWRVLSYQHLAVSASSLGTSAPVTAADRGVVRIIADVDVWAAVSGPFTTTANSKPLFIPASGVGLLKMPALNTTTRSLGQRVIIFIGEQTGSIHIMEIE